MAKNDLLHGNTRLLVLALLDTQDMYGYQIIKELKTRSENAFELKEGSLYPVLYAMESNRLVTSYEQECGKRRRRRYYRITEKGRRELAEKKSDFLSFTTAAKRVLEYAPA